MEITDTSLGSLSKRVKYLKLDWLSKEPFRYVAIDNFLPVPIAQEILAAYPEPDEKGWDSTTYVHQRKKFTKTRDFPLPIARFFAMTAQKPFLDVISQITGVSSLIHDPDLVGGGLHQSLRGAFLDVHVDYNYHPGTKLHRRLNLIVYLNKDWKREYEGCLELWDMEKKRQLACIEPLFNRAVIFETNEISYHGHPAPLNCPQNVSRKSLAVYYYTEKRDDIEIAPEHNTVYVQTTGAGGYAKTILSAGSAVVERMREKGISSAAKNIIRKAAGHSSENKMGD